MHVNFVDLRGPSVPISCKYHPKKLCFEHFTSQVQLAGHNCRGIRILDYKCSICDRNFMSSANLASHMKWHDQQVSKVRKYFQIENSVLWVPKFFYRYPRESTTIWWMRKRPGKSTVWHAIKLLHRKHISNDIFKLFIRNWTKYQMRIENAGHENGH